LYWDCPFQSLLQKNRAIPFLYKNIIGTTNYNCLNELSCLTLFFLINFYQMKNTKKEKEVFQILCPCCQSLLWIDPVSQDVIQSKKGGGKAKKTLDELLLQEKKRKSEFDRKFEATAELQKKKKEKVEEGFRKALTKAGKED